MNRLFNKFYIRSITDNSGMELVQVAILIAIAIVLGLIFNKQLTSFVNGIFKDLLHAKF